MNREFISYEQALALKELGFDEPCFKGYTEEYKTLINFSNTHTNTSVKNALPTKSFTAPLYQQAFRFFLEKYKLHGYVDEDNVYRIYGGVWDVNNYKGCRYDYDSDPYINHEEAEFCCIEKLIEIVRQELNYEKSKMY